MTVLEIKRNEKSFTLKAVLLCLFFCFLNSASTAQSYREKIDTLVPEIEVNIQQNDTSKTLELVNTLYQLDTILPDDAAFYLGYTLYKFGEIKAGKTALLRYIDLTKEVGKYFDSTQNIINQIDVTLTQYDTNYCDICQILGELQELDTCKICEGSKYTEQNCGRCAGIGYEKCPTCGGSGFEFVQGNFTAKYSPCHTCHKGGVVTCRNCDGKLTENKLCVSCAGHGVAPKERECTHRTLINAPITPQNDKKKQHFYR